MIFCFLKQNTNTAFDSNEMLTFFDEYHRIDSMIGILAQILHRFTEHGFGLVAVLDHITPIFIEFQQIGITKNDRHTSANGKSSIMGWVKLK